MPNGYPDGPTVITVACDVCGNIVADVRLDDKGQLAIGGFPGPADEWSAQLARLYPRPGVVEKPGSRPWLTLLSWSPERAVVLCQCGRKIPIDVDQICAAYEAGRRGRILVSELLQFAEVGQ